MVFFVVIFFGYYISTCIDIFYFGGYHTPSFIAFFWIIYSDLKRNFGGGWGGIVWGGGLFEEEVYMHRISEAVKMGINRTEGKRDGGKR